MNVTVPEGSQAGSVFQVQQPDGQVVNVHVPPNASGRMQLQVPLQPTPAVIDLDDPASWPNYGETDPRGKLRFSIGMRIEMYCSWENAPKDWIQGTITHLNYSDPNVNAATLAKMTGNAGRSEQCLENSLQHLELSEDGHPMYPYALVFTDPKVPRDPNFPQGYPIACCASDKGQDIRPLGLAKPSTLRKENGSSIDEVYVDPICSNCQMTSLEAGKTLSNCGSCKRVKYCCRTCQREDYPKHKSICKAIVNEKKRLSVERKKIITENATTEQLRTALHQAVNEGDHATIKRILKKKAGCFDINTVDKDGYSLLHTASSRGFTSVVKVLIKVDGIDVNRVHDRDGISAFYWACENGHIPIINLLLKVPGIEINPIACDGVNGGQASAFWFACLLGRTAVIRRLLKVKGIDFNRPDKYGSTPLHIASQNNFVPIVDLLLKMDGIDVNYPMLSKMNGNGDRTSVSPLFVASERGLTSVVDLLLKHKNIDVNQTNEYNVTPLFRACINGHVEVVRLLVKHPNIDLNATISLAPDTTPLSVAMARKHKKVVKILKSVGARGGAPPTF